MKNSILLLLFIFLVSFGCSSVEKVGTGIVGHAIKNASPEILTESNWNMVEVALPANLKMIESLLYIRPTDRDLLHTLVKGYAAYGMMVHETLWWEKELAKSDSSKEKGNALAAYNRALTYAFRYLANYHLTPEKLSSAQQQGELKNILDSEFSINNSQHQEVIFFLAQAWGGMINLQKDRPLLISMLPTVKTLFDWVCDAYPEFYYGSCDFFYGVYETGRPAMLGGNPVKGRSIFETAIAKYPQNLLLHLAYIQYVLLPEDDVKNIQREQELLTKLFVTFKKEQQQFNFDSVAPKTFTIPGLNFFNATAERRFDALKKYQP